MPLVIFAAVVIVAWTIGGGPLVLEAAVTTAGLFLLVLAAVALFFVVGMVWATFGTSAAIQAGLGIAVFVGLWAVVGPPSTSLRNIFDRPAAATAAPDEPARWDVGP